VRPFGAHPITEKLVPHFFLFSFFWSHDPGYVSPSPTRPDHCLKNETAPHFIANHAQIQTNPNRVTSSPTTPFFTTRVPQSLPSTGSHRSRGHDTPRPPLQGAGGRGPPAAPAGVRRPRPPRVHGPPAPPRATDHPAASSSPVPAKSRPNLFWAVDS